MSISVRLHLQTQVVSIMENLAKSAIAEISKVINEETEMLLLAVSQSKKDNEALNQRLLQMEKELQAARGGRTLAEDGIHTVNLQIGDEIRGTDMMASDRNEDRSLSVENVFGKQQSVSLWKDGGRTAMKEEEVQVNPVISEEALQRVDDRPGLFSVKVELFEGNIEDCDPGGGLRSSGHFEQESDPTERQYSEEADPLLVPAEVTEEASTQWTDAGDQLEPCTLPITMEGTAEMHAVSQSKKDNEALNQRLRQLEKELQAARGGRTLAEDGIHTVKLQIGDEIRGTDMMASDRNDDRSLSVENVFGKQQSVSLWKDGGCTAMKEEEVQVNPVISEEALQRVDNRPGLFSVKLELFEGNIEDFDPVGGLRSSGRFERESDSTERQYSEEVDQLLVPTEGTEEASTQWTDAGDQLEPCTLPITMEGTAEMHAGPDPPQFSVGSEDAYGMDNLDPQEVKRRMARERQRKRRQTLRENPEKRAEMLRKDAERRRKKRAEEARVPKSWIEIVVRRRNDRNRQRKCRMEKAAKEGRVIKPRQQYLKSSPHHIIGASPL
ncbi:hypothetical protein GJAV_G00220530 [Gymnothorax javanicus]|nr:hypothetical protein GJAV_G00220530 [Gymnothorax javanicus]